MTEYEIKRLEDRIRERWNEKEGLLKENAELKKENEQEKKLNAEIKARFVKCNTCTDEMKSKCLMFSENLCEGERCEELVDLMALVSQNDLQKENEQLKEQIEKMKKYGKLLLDICVVMGNDPYVIWAGLQNRVKTLWDTDEEERGYKMTEGILDRMLKITAVDWAEIDKWEIKENG